MKTITTSKGRSRKSHLTLKWGTLKTWDFSEDLEAADLLREYSELGSSMSAIVQKDNKRQKKILCKLIDRVYGKIYLDWDGKYVTHKEAKKYVMGYSK